jgi:flagellar protein FlaG
MFDTVQNAALKIQGPNATMTASNASPLKPVPSMPSAETGNGKSSPSTGATSSQLPDKQVTKALMDEIEKDMAAIQNTGLQFSVHEKTGKIVVEVVDKTTQKTIREIPPKSIQDLAERMDEMLGILFDKKA